MLSYSCMVMHVISFRRVWQKPEVTPDAGHLKISEEMMQLV